MRQHSNSTVTRLNSRGAECDFGQRHLAVVAVARVGDGDHPDRHAVHQRRRLEAVLGRAPQARRRGDVARLVEARLSDLSPAPAVVEGAVLAATC